MDEPIAADEGFEENSDEGSDASGSWATAESSEPDLGVASTSAEVDPARSKGVGLHGCTHYRRRCKLVAPCCDEPFW